jgi:hypothetical protein
MDCIEDGNPKIFVIDVLMSTAFDVYKSHVDKYDPHTLINVLNDVKRRSPQVLHIKYTNVPQHEFNFEVVRSKLINTLTHQERKFSTYLHERTVVQIEKFKNLYKSK